MPDGTVSAVAAIHLGDRLPGRSSNQPGQLGAKPAYRFRGTLPLFGFAPGGVCRAEPVARLPVRFCRTLHPLVYHNRTWHKLDSNSKLDA